MAMQLNNAKPFFFGRIAIEITEKEVSEFGRILIDLWRQRKNNNMLMEKKKKRAYPARPRSGMSNKSTHRQKQPAEKEVSKFGRIVIDLWRQRKNNNMLMEEEKKRAYPFVFVCQFIEHAGHGYSCP